MKFMQNVIQFHRRDAGGVTLSRLVKGKALTNRDITWTVQKEEQIQSHLLFVGLLQKYKIFYYLSGKYTRCNFHNDVIIHLNINIHSQSPAMR